MFKNMLLPERIEDLSNSMLNYKPNNQLAVGSSLILTIADNEKQLNFSLSKVKKKPDTKLLEKIPALLSDLTNISITTNNSHNLSIKINEFDPLIIQTTLLLILYLIDLHGLKGANSFRTEVEKRFMLFTEELQKPIESFESDQLVQIGKMLLKICDCMAQKILSSQDLIYELDITTHKPNPQGVLLISGANHRLTSLRMHSESLKKSADRLSSKIRETKSQRMINSLGKFVQQYEMNSLKSTDFSTKGVHLLGPSILKLCKLIEEGSSLLNQAHEATIYASIARQRMLQDVRRLADLRQDFLLRYSRLNKNVFALTAFTREEVKQLQELIGDICLKLHDIDLENTDYAKTPFTPAEIFEIDKALLEINTKIAQQLHGKFFKFNSIEISLYHFYEECSKLPDEIPWHEREQLNAYYQKDPCLESAHTLLEHVIEVDVRAVTLANIIAEADINKVQAYISAQPDLDIATRLPVRARTIWHTAVDSMPDGNSAILQLLLDNYFTQIKTEPRLLDIKDEDGLAPLHYAAINGNIAAMRLLISYGADSKITDRKGETALAYIEQLDNLSADKRLAANEIVQNSELLQEELYQRKKTEAKPVTSSWLNSYFSSWFSPSKLHSPESKTLLSEMDEQAARQKKYN